MALNIVNQLKAKLSSAEEAAIKQKPTSDLMAYDLFVRARSLIDSTGFSSQPDQGLREAARLLEEAVARDPNFLRAYCELAWVHDTFYIYGVDRTPSRVAMASMLSSRPASSMERVATARPIWETRPSSIAFTAPLPITRRMPFPVR